MRISEYVEFEQGDVVRLLTNWYERNGFPMKEGDIFIVNYQDGSEDVHTNKGIFSVDELELAE